MIKKKIAILGATSHVAKGLIFNFLDGENCELHLFSRSPEKVKSFLKSLEKKAKKYCIPHSYSNFRKYHYDALINCVGIGTLKNRGKFSDYFFVNEKFDDLSLGYLQEINPKAVYISFSSGAVYGRNFSVPAGEKTTNNIAVNNIQKEDYYSLMRLNLEAKHRSLNHLNIVDLRIFSYFSRWIDLTDGYFMADLINAVKHKKTLLTDDKNMTRDFVHPMDLFQVITKCLSKKKINGAFDLFSKKPYTKKDILNYFYKNYGLRYKIKPNRRSISPTGSKNKYYSEYKNASKIGYRPKFNSLDAIAEESGYILQKIK